MRNCASEVWCCRTIPERPAIALLAHGNIAGWSMPVVSAKPSIRFMFCTAWPEAPLVRLSSTETMNGAALDAIGDDPDEGHVGAAHVPGLRRLAERQHVHERLVARRPSSNIACRSCAVLPPPPSHVDRRQHSHGSSAADAA